MNQGVYSLAATMVNQLNRVDVLSNNLANANTTAFKKDNIVEGSFNYYMDKNKKNGEETTKLNEVINTVPKIDGNYFSNIQGAIVQTANQFDFSIKEKDVFFKIENQNKDVLLTRDGEFKSLNGFLVTSDGYNVLSVNNERIAIEDGFESQIQLIQSSFNNLEKQGNNNYKLKNDLDSREINNNDEYLLQGSIEKSNVNTITTMVSLIDSQRRLEQAQKAITGIDEINQKLIDKVTR